MIFLRTPWFLAQIESPKSFRSLRGWAFSTWDLKRKAPTYFNRRVTLLGFSVLF